MDTSKTADTVNECAVILTFLSHCLDTDPNVSPQAMSHNAHAGLSLLLEQISERLLNTGDHIANNNKEPEGL